MKFWKIYIALLLIVAIYAVGGIGYYIGFCSAPVEKPTLRYAETIAVTADNEVYAQTKDGNIYSWYEDGETPIADLYVLALVSGCVENALPVHVANVVIVEE